MDLEKEIHAKEFNSNMFSTCFNECVTAFNSPNLTPGEGKCLKSCYVTFSKKLQQAGNEMNYDCKLNYNFK